MMIRKSVVCHCQYWSYSFHHLSGQEGCFLTLKGYKTVSDYPVYTPDDLWDYINGAADAYLALGFLTST